MLIDQDQIQTFFAKLQARLADAANETEVRGRFCAEVYAQYSITFRMERGRSDAQTDHTILEFKARGLFRGSSASAKFREAYRQLTEQYIPRQAARDRLAEHEYIGIAIDGRHYAFVFFEENGAHRHTALFPITTESLYPLLNALVMRTRRAFTLENLLEDFGPESTAARAVIPELWGHLNTCLAETGRAQKVKMLFQEWAKLFAQATNLGRIGRAGIDNYLLRIGLTPPLDHTRALFVLHTYNALLLKLIAGEVVTTLRYERYSGFAAEAAACSPDTLQDLLREHIEHAEIFVNNDIENFIEGTFFSWYLEDAPMSLLESFREILTPLSLFVFPTKSQRHVRDVIKAFYQYLVPEVLRKNIGEFYTPEWLVEFVLDEAGYRSEHVLTKRLLDPCCGSGNFLIHAIARFKAAAGTVGMPPKATLATLLRSVVGFDLNPLAVLSARLNYLLAIADLLPEAGRIEIPVYMADAVYAPVHEENGGAATRAYKIGTVQGAIDLELPEALVQHQADFGRVLSLMERSIEAHASRELFLRDVQRVERLRRALDSNPAWAGLLGKMFDTLQEMERQNWNRIWCRIVRNYFASVAVGKVDVIASNPPWVRWSELPEDYRERIKPTCMQYAIFSETPFFGGNELDISGMIAYTVTDKWLAHGGVLAFVITQIHFQAPSSQGFRAFALPDGTPLGIEAVHDFTAVKPFPRLANKPAVFTWTPGHETAYPVPYTRWARKARAALDEHAALEEVLPLLAADELVATPIPPDQRWSILPAQHVDLVLKLQGGSSHWRGRKGITVDLNGVFFVELLGLGAQAGHVRIRTTPYSGRKPIPLIDRDVEAELIYPLLKSGKQIRPFSYTPFELVALVPNNVITSIPSAEDFALAYPATYRYFQRINRAMDNVGKPLLENRSTWRSRMKPMGAPFYAIYNVGPYTFAPYKVAWAEMAGSMAATVVSTQTLPHDLGTKVVIPDHKVYFVPCQGEDEAHYLCALLNSEPVRLFVDSFTLKIQVGTLFRHLKLPAYTATDDLHGTLATLSKQAHASGLSDELKDEIDEAAWELTGRM